jgi:SAM-dependent methyltransferase
VFNRVADLYDRARPGYPREVVTELRRLCHIDGNTSALEIGCGTGQLTGDLAATGARIRCVEPGSSLADLARTNLARFSNVEVTTSTFEDFECPSHYYDVVVSATAFHWIDPSVSFAKVALTLKPHGYLALLTNVHTRGGSDAKPELSEGVRELHRRLAPEIGDWTFPTAIDISERATAGGDIAQVWARVERKLWDPPTVSDRFQPPIVLAHPWLATYTTDAYLAMLGSQSSYALMEPSRREELFTGIGRLIEQHLDGVATKEYVTVLVVASKRSADP